MDRIYKLEGVVQHYSWGGTHFIPQLLGIHNASEEPFAEYWLGAHENAPARLVEKNTSLHQLIAEHPGETLGNAVAAKFGALPFLFKILDVRQMLSIQVHPSKASAAIEFEKENERGIPLTASNRNYKDKNHKPELMVALSNFWLLHGFKTPEKLKTRLLAVEELRFLLPLFESGGYKALYEEVMTMPQEKVNEVIRPLMNRIVPRYEQGLLKKEDEHFWAARAVLTFCKNDCYDRGIFSVYLFNLLHLEEGEAIYQPAGLPHAYLEGQNVEVMANSDNVLRAGLTEKHVDVPELMKHVKFESTVANIIRRSPEREQGFDAPVEEFLLRKYLVRQPMEFFSETASLFFIYGGKGMARDDKKFLPVIKGDAVFAIAGTTLWVEPSEEIILYRVNTP